MKKTNIFIVCLLVTAPFVVAGDYKLSADQMDTVLLAQLQNQDRDQLQSRTQEQIGKDDPAYLQAMHQHQFREKNALSIQNMIQEAKMKGLPTEPMRSKVHEGIAKRIDEEAIVRAVKQVQSRYENAYRHARGLSDDRQQVRSMGNRLAEANAAGFSNENAAKIMAQLQDRARNMNREQAYELAHETIKGVRNMARQGVSSATVANVYSNALKHAYQIKEMQALQRSFAKQAMHSNPENVANGFFQEIGRGIRGGRLGASGGNGASGGSGSGSGGGSGGSGSGGGSGGSGSGGGSGGSGSGGGSGGSGSGGGSGGSGGGH